ncbi:MAG: methylmalonyl Co-A mutase-associated GTPase MeaB [Pseudomonadota bacterium]
MKLLEEALNGSVRSLGKLISLVENESTGFQEVLKAVYSHTGNARVIGVTGPPGVGKSTLVARLAERYQKKNHSVGILAVDPSSPISGGSLLGDRIRMSYLSPADNIFIRSLSSRGTLGGISQATMNVVRILDAVGRDIIIIETVGVGQDEVEVIHVADTAILVLAPGFGDEIQALKAGIMEVADIFVINKADQPDTSKYVHTLEKMVQHLSPPKKWDPPIVKTIALNNQGIEDLMEKVDEHLLFLQKDDSAAYQKKKKVTREVHRLAGQKIRQELDTFLEEKGNFDALLKNLLKDGKDPYSIAEEIVTLFWKSHQEPE